MHQSRRQREEEEEEELNGKHLSCQCMISSVHKSL